MKKINLEGEINWLYLQYANEYGPEAFQILKKESEVLIVDEDALNLFFVKDKKDFEIFLSDRESYMGEEISRCWVEDSEKTEVRIDSFFGKDDQEDSSKEDLFSIVKKVFDLIMDDSQLDDFLAALTEEQSNALYSHPLLGYYDLLP